VETTNGNADDQTLGSWLEEWLSLCVLRGLRQTSVESYRTAISLYVPANLSARDMQSIRPQHLNGLYRSMLTDGRRDGRGGLSSRTVRFVHTILRKALADAVRHGVLDSNPAQAADAPSRGAARSPVFPTWTPAELREFLVSARGDEHYAAFHLAAATGLRRSELLGLRWCDTDLESGELRVLQTVVLTGNRVDFGLPKTDRSRRVVALDRRTVAVLREHRRAAAGRSEAEGHEFSEQALVFSGRDGGPIHPALFTYYFQRRIRAAGVRKIRLHDLRHTHATHALQAGVHPKIVSERLGHSTVMITLDTYSHALPSMQREAAELVAALVGDPPHRQRPDREP
jgi:integrase